MTTLRLAVCMLVFALCAGVARAQGVDEPELVPLAPIAPTAPAPAPAQAADSPAPTAPTDPGQAATPPVVPATAPAEAAPAVAPTPSLQRLAVVNLTYSGLGQNIKGEMLRARLYRQIEKAGRTYATDSEVQQYYQTEEGKARANDVSRKASQDTGLALGAGFVITGDIRRDHDGKIVINLDLYDTQGSPRLAHRDKTAEAGKDFGPILDALAADLIGLAEPPKAVAAAVLPSEIAAAPKDDNAAQKAKEDRFYKGELTTIGPLEIIPWRDRAGVLVGLRQLNYTYYAHVEPQVDLHFFPDELTREGKLRMGFSVPLNLEILSREDRNQDGKLDMWNNAGHVRSEDWDSWRDGFKIIRYIQYGRKEDKLYANLNRVYAASIGHGEVMKRYIANLDYFDTRLSAEVDAYSDYGGGEFYTNDVSYPNIISGLAFLKPGSFFSDNWMAKSLSFGVHYTTDWSAPKTTNDVRPRKDGGYLYDPTAIHFIGGDIELKVVNWPEEHPEVDVKIYSDFTKWLDHGAGVAVGMLGRYNLYTRIRQAFRTRAEFRVFQDNYTPSYFDPFYEIMKYHYFSQSHPGTFPSSTVESLRTKYAWYSSRPGDWKHAGAYLEFSYALLDYIGITVAFDRYSGQDNGNALFHIEVPATKYVQLEATYYKTNVNSFKNIFDATASNTMFISLIRLRPVQLLAIQGGVRRITQPSQTYFPALDGIWDFKADIEISWEF